MRAQLGRTPDEDEQVILQYDVITHGQVYIISRELPEITGADLKTYAKEIDISMAKEWTSWNGHHSFIPILRNKAVNVIDAR